MSDNYFTPASDSHRKKEKEKARVLRTSVWWKQVLGKGVCYHCEKKFAPAELTMDHLIPIARGGKSDKKNCVPSCKDCNTKKGYKTRAELAMDELSADAVSKKPQVPSDD
jgi:5-methylcytosine-specific restriction protein A